jgi:4-amino-4-deoxy-L-arabinose transferase-like glycosyltransferase
MKRLLEALLLLLILLLAAYLRLHQVSTNPGWYTDETTHIDIARHLLNGENRYLAIQHSTLLFARLPLFEYLLAATFKLFGDGISTLRTLTTLLGVLSVLSLYGVVRWMQGGRTLALTGALLLAIYPQAILYSRFGFSYNLLPPLLLIALAGLWSYLEQDSRSGLALAALLVGLGTTSEVMMMTVIPVVLLVVIWHNRRDGWWALLLMLLPFAFYAGLMLLSSPDAFLFDLRFTLSRVSGFTLIDQVQNLALNYTTLLTQDSWILAGVIGLFLLPQPRLRGLALLMLFIPPAIMGRNIALYSLSFYYLIPLLPLVALGVASLLIQVVRYLDQLLPVTPTVPGRRLITAGLSLIIAVSPLLMLTSLTLRSVETRWQTAIDPFLVVPEDAVNAAAYLRQHVTAPEIIIASPAFGWQLSDRVNVADFQMSVAYTGVDTPHLPYNIPPERWAFDPRLETASWVVVDNLWTNWGAVHIPGVALLHEVETSWRLVYESGAVRVYRRPLTLSGSN